jgi:YgiT-type zinc finger domain-containing protein
MTRDHDRCSRCRAKTRDQLITYTQTSAGKVAIVEDVPALVCSQCGEIYLTPETVDAIREQIEHGQSTETRQVSVFRVPQPTPNPAQ